MVEMMLNITEQHTLESRNERRCNLIEERIQWIAFHVSVNVAGENEMEYLDYIDTPSHNIEEFNMPAKQNDLLFGLYSSFNDTFGILIGDYEDERMKKEDVPKALAMAIAFKDKAANDETKEAASKLIEILTFAKEHDSLVEFWF